MGAKQALEHSIQVWQDEVEYADTLRDRRKLFAAALFAAAGLGVFRIDLHVSPDQVPAISSPGMSVALKICILIAGILFAFGAVFLFRSSRRFREQSPKRASEILALSHKEVEVMTRGEPKGLTERIRIDRYRLATLVLAKANRRVSENIKRGASLIAVGYAFLALAAGIYTFGRDGGTNPYQDVLGQQKDSDDDSHYGTDSLRFEVELERRSSD